jgi:hypothetical protein
MYSHLESSVPFKKGQAVKRGAVIGTAGSAGTSYSNPHLHFEMFYGEGVSASNRRGVPLSFIEGHDFPDHGKCNQYMGVRLTARAGNASQNVDKNAPSAPTLVDPGQGVNQIVRWESTDADSGLKGYQVYVGQDAQGSGDWFVAEPQVALPTLSSGRTVVRVRALDNAGNASAWSTVLELNVP